MTNPLLQEVEEDLQSKKFRVKLNEMYHGIDVSLFAENEKTEKKLFMYVLDSERALPAHIINLYNIKEGNSKILRIPNCEYMVYSPNGAVENAVLMSKQKGIPIYTDGKEFKKAILKYSPDKN